MPFFSEEMNVTCSREMIVTYSGEINLICSR